MKRPQPPDANDFDLQRRAPFNSEQRRCALDALRGTRSERIIIGCMLLLGVPLYFLFETLIWFIRMLVGV